MNLAEFANADNGESVFIDPAFVGAIGTSGHGVVIILKSKTGAAFHVHGLVENVVRLLHQAEQQEWTPPVEAERLTKE